MSVVGGSVPGMTTEKGTEVHGAPARKDSDGAEERGRGRAAGPLGVEGAAEPVPLRSVLPRITAAAPHLLPWAGLLAAAAYAVLLVWYRSFYGYFGVAPSDVGLDRLEVLTQAAVAGALFGGVAFGAFGVELLFTGREPAPPLWRIPLLRTIVLVSALSAAVLAALGLAPVAIVPATFAVAWLGRYGYKRLRRRPLRALSPTARRNMQVGYISSVALVCGLFGLAENGTAAARDAAAGRPPGGLAAALGVRLQPLVVTTTDGRTPAWAHGRRLVLVGRSTAGIVLHDPSAGWTLVVPADGLVLSTTRNSAAS
jgi:hypothetical protein